MTIRNFTICFSALVMGGWATLTGCGESRVHATPTPLPPAELAEIETGSGTVLICQVDPNVMADRNADADYGVDFAADTAFDSEILAARLLGAGYEERPLSEATGLGETQRDRFRASHCGFDIYADDLESRVYVKAQRDRFWVPMISLYSRWARRVHQPDLCDDRSRRLSSTRPAPRTPSGP